MELDKIGQDRIRWDRMVWGCDRCGAVVSIHSAFTNILSEITIITSTERGKQYSFYYSHAVKVGHLLKQ